MSDMELALMARSGKLHRDDHIWCSGMRDWVPAGSVRGLIPVPEIPKATAAFHAPVVAPRPAAAAAVPACSLFEHYQRSVAEHERAAQARRIAAAIPAEAHPAAQHAFAAPQSAGDAGDLEPDDDWQKLCAALRPAAIPGEAIDTAGSPVQVDQRAAMPVPAVAAVATYPVVSAPSRAGDTVPDVSPAGAAWYSPSEVAGGDFGTYVADSIVLALVRYDIKNLEDLTSDKRLQVVCVYTYDCMPGSFRAIIGPTIGRAAVESVLFSFLCNARSRIPPDKRTADLHATIRELAASPWLSEQLSELYRNARSGIGSLVSSYIPTASSATAWAQSATERLAWLNRPSLPPVAQPLQLPEPRSAA